jgi:hypothetical protein
MAMNFIAVSAIGAQSPVYKMSRRNAKRANDDENNFSQKIFFKKDVGKNNENDSRSKKKQSSDFAVLPEISRQQTDCSNDD